jgi:hypothetical protein
MTIRVRQSLVSGRNSFQLETRECTSPYRYIRGTWGVVNVASTLAWTVVRTVATGSLNCLTSRVDRSLRDRKGGRVPYAKTEWGTAPSGSEAASR